MMQGWLYRCEDIYFLFYQIFGQAQRDLFRELND